MSEGNKLILNFATAVRWLISLEIGMVTGSAELISESLKVVDVALSNIKKAAASRLGNDDGEEKELHDEAGSKGGTKKQPGH